MWGDSRDRTYVPGESLANAANSTDGSTSLGNRPRLPEASSSQTGGAPADQSNRGRSLYDVSAPPELANHPDYELIKQLGQGGMGTVYLAKNRMMDRLEVLKVISQAVLDKPGARERFLREIQSAASLHHANIVAAYSVFRLGDALVFAMEYVKGQDLEKVVAGRGYLPVANAAFYIHQVALGLQHAHEKGLVHRDIKPNNLMLAIEGKKHTVKVLDFGLAKATSEKSTEAGLTKSGQMLGTPLFVAPEQTLDAHTADIRADIYSLGCTLYYLLSGHPPFEEQSLYALLEAHHKRDARPLNLVRPEVPVELAAVVATMMAKDATKRYQTPGDVAKALVLFFKPGQSLAAALPTDASRTAPPGETLHALSTATPAAAATPPPTPLPAPMPIASPISVATSEPADLLGVSIDTHRPAKKRRFDWRSLPPWQRYTLAAAFAAAALVLGVILIVPVKDGVIRIEINDPQIEVAVKGTEIVLKQADNGHDVKLSPGDKTLLVARGDFSFETDKLILKKGETVSVTVTLLDGRIDVTQGERLVGHGNVPSPPEIVRISDPKLDLRDKKTLLTLQYEFAPERTLAEGRCYWVIRLPDRTTELEYQTAALQKKGQLAHLFDNPSAGGGFDKEWSTELQVERNGQRTRVSNVVEVAATSDDLGFDTRPKPVTAALQGHSAKAQLLGATSGGSRGDSWPRCPRSLGVQFLAFTPDGSRLVSASNSGYEPAPYQIQPGSDNSVRVWTLDPPRQVWQFNVNQGCRYGPQGLAVSPDGRFVCVSASWYWGGDPDPTIQVLDIQTGFKKHNFKLSGNRAMRAVAFSKNGTDVYAARGGKNLHEWSLQTGTETAVVERGNTTNSGEMPLANLFMPDGDRIVSGGWKGVIRMWDRKSGGQIKEYHGHQKNLTSIAVSPDGTRIISAAEDNSVRVWDANSGTELLAFVGLNVLVNSVAIAPNNKWFVTGENDGAVRIRDAATRKELLNLLGGSGPILSVAISPSGRMIAAGGEDGRILLWNIAPSVEAAANEPTAASEALPFAGTVPISVRSQSGVSDNASKPALLDVSADSAPPLAEAPLPASLPPVETGSLPTNTTSETSMRDESVSGKDTVPESQEATKSGTRKNVRRSPGKPLDLLKQLDVKRPGTVGEWRMEGGSLVFPQIEAPSIAIYENAPEEYALSALLHCASHVGPIVFGIVVRNAQAIVALDGYQKQGSALALIDGWHKDNPTWVPGAVLTDGAPNLIEITVRKSRVQVSCNRRQLIDWMGDPSTLSLKPPLVGRHSARQLFVSMGRASPFVVSKLTLTPLANDREQVPGDVSGQADFAEIVAEVAPRFTIAPPVSVYGVAIVPEHFGRKRVLYTHPVDANRPCILSATLNVPRRKKTRLVLDVSHHPSGDWQLLVTANGEQLYDGAVGPSTVTNGWLTLSLDLTRFAGKQVALELHNKATGWQFECGYWGKVQIVSR